MRFGRAASPAATSGFRCGCSAIDSDRGLALCRDERGAAEHGRDRARRSRSTVGDELLVHAGTAIARLGGGGDRVRFVDEFRDAELGRALAGEILSLVEPGRHYKVMEVCGGHTHSIYKYGVDDLLPENVELVHGPGCPVCVIPMGRVDDGMAIARQRGRDLHLLRRHDAGPGLGADASSTRRRRAPTSAWSTRRSTRCGSRRRTPTGTWSSSRSASRRPLPPPR